MTTQAFKNCLKLKNILITRNNFPVLPERFAETCSALTLLQITNNHITTIHKDALKGLINLNEIQFEKNKITMLDPLTFIPVKRRTFCQQTFCKQTIFVCSEMFVQTFQTKRVVQLQLFFSNKKITIFDFILIYNRWTNSCSRNQHAQ
jgi:Leucine-rich repeat (LRR) protein